MLLYFFKNEEDLTIYIERLSRLLCLSFIYSLYDYVTIFARDIVFKQALFLVFFLRFKFFLLNFTTSSVRSLYDYITTLILLLLKHKAFFLMFSLRFEDFYRAFIYFLFEFFL